MRMATTALIVATLLGSMSGHAATPPCSITLGVVMELTGAAGAYGQAAAKAATLAIDDLNAAAGAGDCTFTTQVRDTQSSPTVAVDAANQLITLHHVPVLIGGIISATTLPILTSVTAPNHVVQISPAASSPRLTELARAGKAGGLFVRTITSDALQGTAAARQALDQHLGKIAIIYANNDFGGGLQQEFARAYEALGGQVVTRTPYNEHQGSYQAEVTRTLATHPDSLYLVSTPVDGATIARAWIAAGGPRRFLLNDGMNSNDFIKAVGAKYLEQAFGTSSGTLPSASSQYFSSAFRTRAHDDPESPAADRSYDATALAGLAVLAAHTRDGAGIRAGLTRVTDPKGEVIHAGADEFAKARRLLKAGRPVRYEGVIGAVSFDAAGDISGPFRLWRIEHGVVRTTGELTADEVAALRARTGQR
jgi:ABC-type branched-subunit amino acid transport system substrate-binding protein